MFVENLQVLLNEFLSPNCNPIQTYKRVSQVLKQLQRNRELVSAHLQRQLFNTFMDHISHGFTDVQYSALETLNLMYGCERQVFAEARVSNKIIELAFDRTTPVMERTRNAATNCFTLLINNLVELGKCDCQALLMKCATKEIMVLVCICLYSPLATFIFM